MSDGTNEVEKTPGPATWMPKEHDAIRIRVQYVATPPKEYTVVESQGDKFDLAELQVMKIHIQHPGVPKTDVTLYCNASLCSVEIEDGKWVHPDDIKKATELYIERKRKSEAAELQARKARRGGRDVVV